MMVDTDIPIEIYSYILQLVPSSVGRIGSLNSGSQLESLLSTICCSVTAKPGKTEILYNSYSISWGVSRDKYSTRLCLVLYLPLVTPPRAVFPYTLMAVL